MRTLLMLLAAVFVAPSAIAADLRIVNGDFSDLDGMTRGRDGWYAGMPRGWSGSGNTYAVFALPGTDPVASTWSGRPFGRIVGWTLVCQGETAPPPSGECREILLVRDADGRYPGPWF